MADEVVFYVLIRVLSVVLDQVHQLVGEVGGEGKIAQ